MFGIQLAFSNRGAKGYKQLKEEVERRMKEDKNYKPDFRFLKPGEIYGKDDYKY